ncbi:DUF1657 domain-containing protein [Pseudalkalibacillus caeni]|uniref:DUF1657 domain-containing protein n=1 Tax=Exobacillus caeni TaxID=2574798 RepID=A0A5R9F5H4_9BACL|nr:DUF1657 domain-containing protein [Pseudalkalibacillus caeni]TLS37586.1 DUF1657 domain-containing protein [Pseudalkalibacillus caeni]
MTVGSQVKQTLAALKSISANLQTYALQSKSEEASRAFHESMLLSDEIIKDLERRIGELERQEPQYKGF